MASLRVATLDEMADAMELFSSPRRVTTGGGIASIHDSGGERVLFVDVAADLGVPFGQISEATTARIQEALDPGLEAANPLDAWGTGIDADRIFIECFHALHDDPDVAALAFVVDMTRQGEPFDAGYLHVAREVFNSTTKPFCIVSNLASAVANDEAALVRDDGIPVLEGTASGLTALRHLLAYRTGRERSPAIAPEPVADDVRDRWRARLATGAEFSELEALALLADYGVPATDARAAASVDGAVAAADEVGWPVAMKTMAPGVQHKSDVGGVVLDLADADALRSAYEDIASRLGPHVVVTPMASARRGGRARHRPRSAVRSARPGGSGRRPRRGPPRPAARNAARGRTRGAGADRSSPDPAVARWCARRARCGRRRDRACRLAALRHGGGSRRPARRGGRQSTDRHV